MTDHRNSSEFKNEKKSGNRNNPYILSFNFLPFIGPNLPQKITLESLTFPHLVHRGGEGGDVHPAVP